MQRAVTSLPEREIAMRPKGALSSAWAVIRRPNRRRSRSRRGPDVPGRWAEGRSLSRTVSWGGGKPGPHAHRRRIPRRPGNRARPRRRRLPAQAVPLPGARAEDPLPGPPQTDRPAPHPARSRDPARPLTPHRDTPRAADRSVPKGVRRARGASSEPRPPPSAPKTCSPGHGTRMPTRSPRPCRSPSAASAASSATPRPSRPSPASDTASPTVWADEALETHGHALRTHRMTESHPRARRR